ncbi:hypothetical protein FBU30_010364 [Linnemannia zychae]|nr:hypothetical protein FBU30_010364 [Linnemannia zychae]
MSFMSGMCLLTRLQELRRVRIFVNSAYIDTKDFFWLRTMPSTMEWVNYATLLPMSRMQIRNILPLDRVPEDDMDWANVVQYAQRFGVDVSKIGLGEDLHDWMCERYVGHCLKTWPQLEEFHIGCLRNLETIRDLQCAARLGFKQLHEICKGPTLAPSILLVGQFDNKYQASLELPCYIINLKL